MLFCSAPPGFPFLSERNPCSGPAVPPGQPCRRHAHCARAALPLRTRGPPTAHARPSRCLARLPPLFSSLFKPAMCILTSGPLHSQISPPISSALHVAVHSKVPLSVRRSLLPSTDNSIPAPAFLTLLYLPLQHPEHPVAAYTLHLFVVCLLPECGFLESRGGVSATALFQALGRC